MSEVPALDPPTNSEVEPFWAGLATDRLLLPVCDACSHVIWYPRSWCPVCGHGSVTWTEMSGRGTVYACTVIRKAMGPWADATPYVSAYIELAEGPRILANVVADPNAVRIGARVAAVFVPVTDPPGASPSRRLLRFAPRGPADG